MYNPGMKYLPVCGVMFVWLSLHVADAWEPEGIGEIKVCEVEYIALDVLREIYDIVVAPSDLPYTPQVRDVVMPCLIWCVDKL